MKALENLFELLNEEEKLPLYKLLGIDKQNNEAIIIKLSKAILPVGGIFQSKLTYRTLLEKLAKHHDINIDTKQSEVEIEKQIFISLFQNEYAKMTDEEKEEFLTNLSSNGLDSNQIKSLTAIASMSAAQASGFGVYLLASSTVGAITSFLGITLPFAFYASMSKVISVIIGPIGFLVMGYPLYKEFKDVKNFNDAWDKTKNLWQGLKSLVVGNYEITTNCIKYIAGIRILKNEEFLKERENKNERIATIVNDKELIKSNLLSLKLEIDKINVEIKNLNEQKRDKIAISDDLIIKQNEKMKAIEIENQELIKINNLINKLNTPT